MYTFVCENQHYTNTFAHNYNILVFKYWSLLPCSENSPICKMQRRIALPFTMIRYNTEEWAQPQILVLLVTFTHSSATQISYDVLNKCSVYMIFSIYMVLLLFHLLAKKLFRREGLAIFRMQSKLGRWLWMESQCDLYRDQTGRITHGHIMTKLIR